MVETVEITENENFKEIQLPLKNSQMQQLQRHDDFCREIARKLALNKHMNKLFMMKQGIVYRLWCENNKTEECIVVPEVLRNPLLMLAQRLQRSQWIQKDVQRTQTPILLARNEKTNPETL